MDSLPANTKNWESTCSWPTRVRFFHPWAALQNTKKCQKQHPVTVLLDPQQYDVLLVRANKRPGGQVQKGAYEYKSL